MFDAKAVPESRRSVIFNPQARGWEAPAGESTDAVDRFHRQLPGYQQTRLVSLDDVAKQAGVKAVYLKDEGSRLGLQSFKILGASWGTFRAIAHALCVPVDADLDSLKQALVSQPLSLFAATDGNHGRAVARMGAILSVPVEIHVPSRMDSQTVELIRAEGAAVVVSTGDYDATVLNAQHAAQKKEGGVLVQDFAFGSYQDIPRWIVEGYSTMLREIDSQLGDTKADLVVVPVGVGCFAQAVVSHYKGKGDETAILKVEPDTSACLWKSLRRGKPSTVKTTSTIMAGMDCGTVSSIAWPLLSSGVDAAATVSDYESHSASLYLQTLSVSAGPCGAAPLAALRRLTLSDRAELGLGPGSTVVLLCTEGTRGYEAPLDVSAEDVATLSQILARISSAGAASRSPETALAQYASAWLQHRDIETRWAEVVAGRPSVVVVSQSHDRGDETLIFDGYVDGTEDRVAASMIASLRAKTTQAETGQRDM